MTENLNGAKSSETVGANMAILNSGGSLKPIKVAQINGKLYVLDGHHRVEAARRTQKSVSYEIVPENQYKDYGYKSATEITHAAAENGRVKLNNKRVNTVANGGN
jgi:uncharacterized ParB-like nuclease family protein